MDGKGQGKRPKGLSTNNNNKKCNNKKCNNKKRLGAQPDEQQRRTKKVPTGF